MELKVRYPNIKQTLKTGLEKKKRLHVKPFSVIVTSLFVFGWQEFQINEWESNVILSYLITRNLGPKADWGAWPRRPLFQPPDCVREWFRSCESRSFCKNACTA